jgi:hypothetical protein
VNTWTDILVETAAAEALDAEIVVTAEIAATGVAGAEIVTIAAEAWT